MIFPQLIKKQSVEVNLDQQARIWYSKILEKSERNESMDEQDDFPHFLIDQHKKLNVSFSYGGWLEDRSFIYRGSYLQRLNTFIHLGIDLNAPVGTQVAVDFDAEVVRIDYDPAENGWGQRVVFRKADEDVYILYAHLDTILQVEVGQFLSSGAVFGSVGPQPVNGVTHTHVQALTGDEYRRVKDDFYSFDGYGGAWELEEIQKKYIDPMKYIKVE